MECFPACVVCTGLCQKVPDKPRRTTPAKPRVRNIDYVELACEHYTTTDVIGQYSCFAPSRAKTWCEKCGSWKGYKRKPRRKALPETAEGLF